MKAYGMTLVPLPIWDEMIVKYQSGTKLNNPHRAVLTTKSNLNIGVDKSSFGICGFEFLNPDSRKENQTVGKFDARGANSELLQVAI